MTDLDKLLERVERAGEGSQELHAQICCALLAPAGSKIEKSPFNGVWCIYAPNRPGKEPFRLWDDLPREIRLGDVTSSIDAAVALCERLFAGWRWRIQADGDGVNEAFLENKGDFGAIDSRQTSSFASTPALALCAAILRAIAQGEK